MPSHPTLTCMVNISNRIASSCIRLTTSPVDADWRAAGDSRSDLRYTAVVSAVRMLYPARTTVQKYCEAAAAGPGVVSADAASQAGPSAAHLVFDDGLARQCEHEEAGEEKAGPKAGGALVGRQLLVLQPLEQLIQHDGRRELQGGVQELEQCADKHGARVDAPQHLRGAAGAAAG